MTIFFRRLTCVLAILAAAASISSAQAQDSIDITGWGTGNVQPVPVDPGRPWGWAVRDFLEVPDRPLYNRAKAKLLNGEQVFSHVISSFDIERYCAEAPNYDYTWFEMQHSLLRYDQVAEMVAACPRIGRINRYACAVEPEVDIPWFGTSSISRNQTRRNFPICL